MLPWNYILAVLAAIVVCGLLGLRNSSRLAGVTITIIMLVHKEGSRWGLALDRVSEVVLGIVVALAVTTLVFPDRARLRLRDGLAQEFLVLGSFFEAILEGFRGAPSPELCRVARRCARPVARQQPTARSRAQRTLRRPGLARRPEPCFPNSAVRIFDALVALQFSVEGSREDGFAQQLEPALGQLAVDIRTGFHHVAGCIHNWRFHIPPQG